MSIAIRRLQPRPALANESLDTVLSSIEREAMISAASEKLEELLDILLIDHQNDPNTRGTPKRVAKMFVNELTRGRTEEPPSLTDFENSHAYEGMIVTGPIDVRSICAHHLMPIRGEAYLGVLPSAKGKMLGLSKYDRIVDHFAARLQTQEELIQQIGNYLWEHTAPNGLAIRISAVHMCRTHRGVRAGNGRMVTSAYFGTFSNDIALKGAFLRECTSLEVPR